MNRKQFFLKKKTTSKTVSPKNKEFALSDEYKTLICSQSYLGKKGYTIPKNILIKEDEEFLRKDLFVKPMIFGANFGGKCADDSSVFPVFRENANKIYLPRFYGIQRYGLPPRSEIGKGEDINVEFTKPLRDYQEKIISVYTDYVNSEICSGSIEKGNGGILEVPCGRGKTIMALKIISLLKKKTLIIVHKEFLMNQWIERIRDFLPEATVGKIQGSMFDIEGKDIVIGMVQTLYDKDYAQDAFSCFGLTIIDEVHRIGSEQFSRTLFKTITPYMLGISATVDRKDKLTRVLHMFIGDKIYSEKREDDDLVSVRAVRYISNDPEFNEVDLDFRGMPKYSTMITKLCAFGPRSDFILRIIKDLVQEEPENQIMILCHNRSLLSYLFDGIIHRKIAEVGYYVGGMKQANLQETEGKQIVLATYAMAAEALDIKTLSTLIMVTPKTDITQSVGRILRVKHENPIIVDIVDSHDLFENQWKQRKRFYKKCNYRIREIDSTKYTNMMVDWDTDKLWTRSFDPKNKTSCANEKQDSEDELDAKSITGSNQAKCLINFANLEGLDD
jgi:superfamily II DNA or RNA helicase